MQCSCIKKNKDRCKAQAIQGTDRCFRHHPDKKQDAIIASQKGGLARLHYQSYHSPIQLSSPQDVQKLLNITINSLLQGKMPSNNPANSIAYLSRCWLDAYEKGEVIERLNNLETLVKSATNEN